MVNIYIRKQKNALNVQKIANNAFLRKNVLNASRIFSSKNTKSILFVFLSVKLAKFK